MIYLQTLIPFNVIFPISIGNHGGRRRKEELRAINRGSENVKLKIHSLNESRKLEEYLE